MKRYVIAVFLGIMLLGSTGFFLEVFEKVDTRGVIPEVMWLFSIFPISLILLIFGTIGIYNTTHRRD